MATKTPEHRIHLICNAHLDPVWLWEWEEGAAEAISTFRTAADLCEEFPGFIFNHNEVTLYKWVQEYEPALFKRIQRLVRQGKWHIMGGWYLQPDCNMPSTESFVRQALLGKTYFREHFGVEPTTAINLDPFGHAHGLPQILVKAGYDSYLFCRPDQNDCPLPDKDFIWVGCDGSEVVGSRVLGWYSSQLGRIGKKIRDFIASYGHMDLNILLWGVGNHGGGPSRDDLRRIARLQPELRKRQSLIHSTPEDYFAEVMQRRDQLRRHSRDLNPWAPGCYSSQIRIKQKHRRIENELYMTEKMATTAAAQKLMAYPREELAAAAHDLMVGEFHDILPGSSIQPVEDASLRMLDHGLEILSRVKARAFFALSSGQPKSRPGEIPILVYNPHPYPIRTAVECEFQLADANWEEVWTGAKAYADGKPLPSQVEVELSNLNLDWRKRIVFEAELQPASMNRFDCKLKTIKAKPAPQLKAKGGTITFKTPAMEVVINTKTGLIDRYRVKGRDYIRPGALQPLVIVDNEDPWGMLVRSYRKVGGRFKLLSRQDAAWFAGTHGPKLAPVRVIEDGEVRTVVEALFGYGRSYLCLRYKLPKHGTEIEADVRVHWNEKDRMLKLAIPTAGRGERYIGQIAGGIGDLPTNGDEAVAQKWVAVVSDRDNKAVSVVNDSVYGSDYADRELRLTLLRSPAYSAHPLLGRQIIPQDRYIPRQEQGERHFRFWLNAGPGKRRLEAIDREALPRNEKPFALSFSPPGAGRKPKAGALLSDDVVQVIALKRAETGDDTIVRLVEPTGHPRQTVLSSPFAGIKKRLSFSPFEIKTLRITARGKVIETDLLERPLRKR